MLVWTQLFLFKKFQISKKIFQISIKFQKKFSNFIKISKKISNFWKVFVLYTSLCTSWYNTKPFLYHIVHRGLVITKVITQRLLLITNFYCLRSKKIDFGQKFLFILFFPGTKGNSCRGFRKSWSQVPKMTSSRDFYDFRFKIVKK